jgi:hypothetical protein
MAEVVVELIKGSVNVFTTVVLAYVILRLTGNV